MESKPSVSVIIPVYNGEKYLDDSIKSILQQTIQPLEIIVVNDGSTDGTEKIAKKYGDVIRYVYQQNGGVAAARNKGLELVRGEYIAFIDADDIWVENKLELQLELFRKNPDHDMVIGLLKRIPFSKMSKIIHEESKNGEYVLQFGCAILKKKIFDKVGIFDESMIIGEDVDLFLRILEAGIKVWSHPDVVQYYRRHDQNITLDERRKNFYLLKAYKKSLDRRRKSGNRKVEDLPKLGNIEEIISYWKSQ